MFSKLPGINSYHKGVRIFSKIYYIFLVLLFCILLIRNRSGIGMYDSIINMCEMFIFWLSFVSPVFVIDYLNKKGFGKAETSIAVSIVIMIFICISMFVGTKYTKEYKAQFGDSMSVIEQK